MAARDGSAEQVFKAACLDLIDRDIYPSPTALNKAVHGRKSNNLGGRETRWRREVMTALKVPLQRPRGSVAARKQMTGRPR